MIVDYGIDGVGPIHIMRAPGGGWYYEIRWPDGLHDWGFRLTRWGARRAAQRLLKGQNR